MQILCNKEIEQHVLGCMFIDSDAVKTCNNLLQPSDFADARHQVIFQAIQQLVEQDEVIDQITVNDTLKRMDKLEAVGGFEYILQLSQHMATAAQLDSYLSKLQDYAQRRKLQQLGLELAYKSKDLELDQEKLWTEVQQKTQEISGNTAVMPVDMLVQTSAYIDEIMSARENPDCIARILTGFSSLDNLLKGLKPGSLNLLAARPSMGKTSLALNFVLNAAINEGKQHKKVLFISLEMTAKEVYDRCSAILTDIDGAKIQEPRDLSDAESDALCQAVANVADLGVIIQQESNFTVNKLRQLIHKMGKNKPDFVVIDYLQLMQTEQRDDSYVKVTKISNGLKALALELKIPILALSQLNRAVENRVIKRPLLSDLRESGSLEQDADVVMLLSRKDYYERQGCAEEGIAELEVAKSRNGATGTVQLFFDKPCSSFLEIG
ncbi:MAG: replicative DNA helicase [Phascolarctobacterium sp.]|nr:replicative DNA helicase [Phascolarctobacterium sp.]